MPTYQYSCSKCGHEFEVFQSMKDDAFEVCPKDKCVRKRWGKGKVKRLMGTGAGLIFKGSGFYITDYRSESYKAGAKKDAPATAAPATPAAPAAGKSEGTGAAAKPAAATPAKPTPKAV
jgi:putative FmdB family regulatory protein